MFGGYYSGGYFSGGVPLYPNPQAPISLSSRTYPGPTHDGYFSWSSSRNPQDQQKQAGIATTVTKARLEESDIYMSHYELSVKMYLAYCHSPQTSRHLTGQVDRALLDEDIDHSRKEGLSISSAIKAAHLEGKAVAEQTQTGLTKNWAPAKTESTGQMPAIAKHARKSSQMPKKTEYLGETYQMPTRTEPPVSHNTRHIDNQHGHQYETHQTARDQMAADHRKPGSSNQWLTMDAQNQGISTGQTLADGTPNTFFSQDDHGYNLYSGWSINPSTRRKADQREIMPQEHTPLPNPIIMVDAPAVPPLKKDISSSNEKPGWRKSSLLAASFSSNNAPSNRAWSSSDLLAANFASPSSSRTSWNKPSGSSNSSSTSQLPKNSNTIHTIGDGPEISSTRRENGSYGSIFANLVSNRPTQFKRELSHLATQPGWLFEKPPPGIPLYETADKPPKPVGQRRGPRLGPFIYPPAPAYGLPPLDKTDVSRPRGPERGRGIADSAKLCDPVHDYCDQPRNSSTYATIANTSGTSLLKEIGCSDLLVLEDGTAPAVAQIGGPGRISGGNAIPHNVALNQTGAGMDFANPSKDPRASHLIHQYLRGFWGPINDENRIWWPVEPTPDRPHSPIPLTTGHETMAEQLERLAMDWEKLTIMKNAVDNCNCGAHKSSTRTPLSSRVLQWLAQDLEDTPNQQLPSKEYLHPEANYHSDRLQWGRKN